MKATAALPDFGRGLRVEPIRYVEADVSESQAGAIDDAQADAVVGIFWALEIAAHGRVEDSRQELLDEVTNPRVLRDTAFLVWDGELAVACGYLSVDTTAMEYNIEALVHPTYSGRSELLSELVAFQLRGVRDRWSGDPGWKVFAGAFAAEVDVLEVFRSHGLERVRSFYRMEIESGSPRVLATAPPCPPDVTIEEAATDEQRRVWQAVQQIAFAEHWGFTPRSYEESWEFLSKMGSAAPHDWLLVRVSEVPAAVALLSDRRREIGEGYVSVLAVHPSFRGRGLAKLLLQRAFVRYRDEGMQGTSLHVDATNTTGALAVYEAVGMRVAREFVLSQLELVPESRSSD